MVKSLAVRRHFHGLSVSTPCNGLSAISRTWVLSNFFYTSTQRQAQDEARQNFEIKFQTPILAFEISMEESNKLFQIIRSKVPHPILKSGLCV